MLLQINMMRGLPVASLTDERKVAEVVDVVLHPNTGELVGFWIQPDGWFARRRALSARDVLGYDPQALVVATSDVFVDPTDIQPFAKIVTGRDSWLGKIAQNQDNEVLGRVTDLVIDADLEMLAKIEVATLFGPKRLIARDSIVKVTPKYIVVDTDSGIALESTRVPEAATS